MIITEQHFLHGIPQILSPNTSGHMQNPTLLVLHYTASGDNKDADSKYFQRPGTASAHLVIERNGRIVQCVPFNKKAWHAGRSSWRGRSGCNNFSIGIEIDNWGLLERRGNGGFYSHAGTAVNPANVFVGPNKLGGGMYWESFTHSQLAATDHAIAAILKAYPTITEIVGHEDVAPRRKIDPGPALYSFMEQMNNKYFSTRNQEDTFKAKVTAVPSLNVRSTPGGSKIDEVLTGKIVDILYSQGEWSRITQPSGWVHNGYLKPV